MRALVETSSDQPNLMKLETIKEGKKTHRHTHKVCLYIHKKLKCIPHRGETLSKTSTE